MRKFINVSLGLVLSIVLVSSLRTSYAHTDPAGCNATGVSISLTTFRADGVTPVGGGTVQSGETLRYQTTLSWAGGNNCYYEGGSVSITDPGGSIHPVGTPGLVNTTPFVSGLATYVVDESNVSGGFLSATTSYTGGFSHRNDGHPPISASTGDSVDYQDVALVVTKTADPAFNSECHWTIDKSVDTAVHNLTTGDSGTSNYTVVVTKTDCTDSDFSVSGTITIHNPALFADAIISDVTDEVSGVGAMTVVCPETLPYNLAPGDDLVCTYSGTLPDDTTRTNTATATTTGDVDGDSGDASVDFSNVNPTTVVNADVDVVDNVEGPLGNCAATVGDNCTYRYSNEFTCDENAGTHDNTATIVETGQYDTVTVTVNCTPAELSGCTPGYWKNHTQTAVWGETTYSPSQTVGSVFAGANPYHNNTLLQALNFGGGGGVEGAKKILLRAAVAALLNAAHPDVDYPRTTAEVIADVNAALASNNRNTMLALAADLDQDNNLGCSIDAHGRVINN